MSKYIRIPFFSVGEEAPNLLLMLDEYYDKSEYFVRFEKSATPIRFDDNESE